MSDQQQCISVVDTNADITGIGVTVAFLAQVCICAAVLLPIRFIRVYKPKTSEDALRFLEPVLTGATDTLAMTCTAHIISAMYTFDTLSYDQVRHILAIHWPASTLFLVATGILWGNMSYKYARLAMRSCCIILVFAISIRTMVSDRLMAQMDCVMLLLQDNGETENGLVSSFKACVVVFPVLTLFFWVWTLLACYVASRHGGPFSKLRRFMNVYADIALLIVPVAIVLVAVNIYTTNTRLAKFRKDRTDNEWSFGQIFSLLMVGESLVEVYQGTAEYYAWKKEGSIEAEVERVEFLVETKNTTVV